MRGFVSLPFLCASVSIPGAGFPITVKQGRL